MKDPLDLGPRKRFVKTSAEKLIKDARVAEAPVSLQQVIEYLQTIRAIDVRKINISEKVSGLLVVCKEVDAEYATIGFNGKHPWCRRRFTIAHEVGHLLLGHACTNNQCDGSHDEEEANMFAGELLVPTKFIKKDFPKMNSLQDLSRLYRVSDQVLTYKLMDAHLV